MFKKTFLLASFLVLIAAFSAFAQEGGREFEAAVSSNLTQVSLPSNANRILPEKVPAEITQTLEKLVAAGGGKLQSGDSEVLVWSGEQYKKVGKTTTLNRLIDTLKAAGWQYEVGGEEDGVTVFHLFKDGAKRRGLLGFYGESDGILIFAWTEVLAKDGSNAETEGTPNTEVSNVQPAGGTARSLIGTWDNGSVSSVTRVPVGGGAPMAGRSHRFEYTFTADGRFSMTGILQTVNYSCTDQLFNEKAGRYTLKGSTLTLTPTKNFWRKTNSCSPGSNSEKNYTLTPETYQFSTKTDEYEKQFICLANAQGETCYRRAQ